MENQHFFRQIKVFAIEVTKEKISRNILRVISLVTVWKSPIKRDHNFYGKIITKELISRNFLRVFLSVTVCVKVL